MVSKVWHGDFTRFISRSIPFSKLMVSQNAQTEQFECFQGDMSQVNKLIHDHLIENKTDNTRLCLDSVLMIRRNVWEI